jgi:hypothetical protein
MIDTFKPLKLAEAALECALSTSARGGAAARP